MPTPLPKSKKKINPRQQKVIDRQQAMYGGRQTPLPPTRNGVTPNRIPGFIGKPKLNAGAAGTGVKPSATEIAGFHSNPNVRAKAAPGAVNEQRSAIVGGTHPALEWNSRLKQPTYREGQAPGRDFTQTQQAIAAGHPGAPRPNAKRTWGTQLPQAIGGSALPPGSSIDTRKMSDEEAEKYGVPKGSTYKDAYWAQKVGGTGKTRRELQNIQTSEKGVSYGKGRNFGQVVQGEKKARKSEAAAKKRAEEMKARRQHDIDVAAAKSGKGGDTDTSEDMLEKAREAQDAADGMAEGEMRDAYLQKAAKYMAKYRGTQTGEEGAETTEAPAAPAAPPVTAGFWQNYWDSAKTGLAGIGDFIGDVISTPTPPMQFQTPGGATPMPTGPQFPYGLPFQGQESVRTVPPTPMPTVREPIQFTPGSSEVGWEPAPKSPPEIDLYGEGYPGMEMADPVTPFSVPPASFTTPGGKTITMKQIEHTAEKWGKSVDDVIFELSRTSGTPIDEIMRALGI